MKKFLVTSTLAFATVAFLGMSQLSAGDGAKCGAGKCGNTTKPVEGKCGSGKCGASAKPSKPSEASKPAKPAPKSAGKCGVGKCG